MVLNVRSSDLSVSSPGLPRFLRRLFDDRPASNTDSDVSVSGDVSVGVDVAVELDEVGVVPDIIEGVRNVSVPEVILEDGEVVENVVNHNSDVVSATSMRDVVLAMLGEDFVREINDALYKELTLLDVPFLIGFCPFYINALYELIGFENLIDFIKGKGDCDRKRIVLSPIDAKRLLDVVNDLNVADVNNRRQLFAMFGTNPDYWDNAKVSLFFEGASRMELAPREFILLNLGNLFEIGGWSETDMERFFNVVPINLGYASRVVLFSLISNMTHVSHEERMDRVEAFVLSPGFQEFSKDINRLRDVFPDIILSEELRIQLASMPTSDFVFFANAYYRFLFKNYRASVSRTQQGVSDNWRFHLADLIPDMRTVSHFFLIAAYHELKSVNGAKSWFPEEFSEIIVSERRLMEAFRS